MLAQYIKRIAGPALASGGLLWIADFIAIIIIGLTTGKLVDTIPTGQEPLIMRIAIWFLPLSMLFLGTGLIGVFARLEGRSKGWGIPGIVFIALPLVMSLINIVGLSGLTASITFSGDLNGLSVIAMSVGIILLGVAVLRSHALPRWIAWVMIVIGIVTFPILIATPLPVGPDWATDHLSFLLSGIAYIVVGTGLGAVSKRSDVSTVSTLTYTTHPAK
jgi:hypothetical protein